MDTLKIKVLIVDDDDLVRDGLRLLLKKFDDIEVVASTGDGRMALTLCAVYQPDVVLMDMFMPRMSGTVATRLIHNRFPAIQIVVLSGSVDQTLMYEVLQAGAISYLLKTGTIHELVSALRAAYHGESTLAQEAIAALIAGPLNQPKLGNDLSQREREVLGYMTEGLNNSDIAQHLTITTSTVKNHVSHIFSKLAVDSRTKVVALAVEYNLYTKVSHAVIKKSRSISVLLPLTAPVP